MCWIFIFNRSYEYVKQLIIQDQTFSNIYFQSLVFVLLYYHEKKISPRIENLWSGGRYVETVIIYWIEDLKILAAENVDI